MENKQTAVEWLIKEIESLITIETFQRWKVLKEQAKQIEKEQVINAHNDGYESISGQAEQYYNEKYGSSTPELRYKDGTPIRKYNSPKLQAIEMENKNFTAVEWLAEKYNYVTWMRNRDEISAELADEWRKDYLEQAKQMEKEQVEISDEEIEKFASDFYDNNGSESIFIMGAKWYREKLKNK